MAGIGRGAILTLGGVGRTTTAAPTKKGPGKSYLQACEVEGTHTYAAHEVQECGSDGWVWLHGVVHDQDGRFCG